MEHIPSARVQALNDEGTWLVRWHRLRRGSRNSVRLIGLWNEMNSDVSVDIHLVKYFRTRVCKLDFVSYFHKDNSAGVVDLANHWPGSNTYHY